MTGTLPVLVPLPFPLPGKATTVDMRLTGSPSGVLQLAGRFADAAVVADLQLGRLPGRAELVLSMNPPRHRPRAAVTPRRIGSPRWVACGEAARVGSVAVVG